MLLSDAYLVFVCVRHWDQVLELAEEFKAYLPDETDAAKATHIDAFQAHVFLERKGTPFTVLELRAMMREICAATFDVIDIILGPFLTKISHVALSFIQYHPRFTRARRMISVPVPVLIER